jgi:hypothetical protein
MPQSSADPAPIPGAWATTGRWTPRDARWRVIRGSAANLAAADVDVVVGAADVDVVAATRARTGGGGWGAVVGAPTSHAPPNPTTTRTRNARTAGMTKR